MKDFMAKPFIVNESADYNNCQQKVEKPSNVVNETLDYMKDITFAQQNTAKVVTAECKVAQKPNAEPRDLDDKTLYNVTCTSTPSDSENNEIPPNSKAKAKHGSNFRSAIIY